MAAFLETLTTTHDASFFHEEAAKLGNPLREGQRGSPLNCGSDLTARHPVIRTNRKLQPAYSSILLREAAATDNFCSLSRHRLQIPLRQ